ncbi:MAG TPA: ATP-binding protein [bacterium]|nr:ATP-binding protein [bacterium]
MINKNIKRIIQDKIESKLFKGKIIVIYGARQVGKTTLVREIQKKYKDSKYLNCDEIDIREALTDKTSTEIKNFLGNKKLIILDEAQRIKNIGITLKLIVDNFPEIQIVATGSSSFDLSNEINEPLTGRKYEFRLYPFSLQELKSIYSDIELDRILEGLLIFGSYPEIIINRDDVIENLKNITSNYLYKDILQFQNLKNPEILEKLLQALALQIGNEVSYNELSSIVGVDKKTISNYINILEKSFVIFRLRPFNKNIRNELRKLRKIYFYDLGIRNALINNFNPVNLRNDFGFLWENFMISERMKYNDYEHNNVNSYFWRTTQKQELDYLEDKNGALSAFEFKFNKDKLTKPKVFLENYKNSSIELINNKNFKKFLNL